MEARLPQAAPIFAARSNSPEPETTERSSGASTPGVGSSEAKAMAYVHAPCSSPQVLFDKLSKIFAIYECVVGVFKGFTPFQVLQFMLASKDLAYLITRDQDLLQLLYTKYFKVRLAPKLVVPCEWCQQPGCECAGCYQWDHSGYVDLAAKPRYTDPTQRLWRFCVDCTENLPKWTRAGSKGFEVWFRKRKVRPQVELSAREKGEAMEPPKYFCKGVDKAGWLCENEVGPLGGLPTDSKAEKLMGGRMVNVCTWCGLIAVDVPNGPPNFGPCPGKATGIFKCCMIRYTTYKCAYWGGR
ncbi:hypothetical protein L211DRAFT_884048 [Terfezia boudieri ATCC MYA-4762]|uniref:Uncharacterized protein n=1 Tax=Terfezia boudieri ATCC MYA-4762 TaxID=1051890 RepID=A0A3N4LMI7_9PEZI|nr:hypothetical protein L211DRAFT_884048 [Terfezia boudieri ATCC MYA-4762]